jgi:hypothetical protein
MARGERHDFAEAVSVPNDHVANRHADAQLQRLRVPMRRRISARFRLAFYGPFDRVVHAGEIDQRAVAEHLE